MKGSGQGPSLKAERDLHLEGWHTVQVGLVRQNMALMERPLFESSFLSQVDGDMTTASFCQSREVLLGPQLSGQGLTCFRLSKAIHLPRTPWNMKL